jgi:SAM-dependent methyltransferase
MCPVDHQLLNRSENFLICTTCQTAFPIIHGVPILINENNSVFRISDYTSGQAYEGASGYGGTTDKTSGIRRLYRSFARYLSEAAVPGSGFDAAKHILTENPNAKILAIGSGERAYSGNAILTDVAFAKDIQCICDAHDIPFPDAYFDAVFADSVLEHVCDPQRCVSEITRVLKPGGYVMAVTPFLQPVHMGAYDFTRFTYLGHRRLFRFYDDVQSGMCGGPGYSAIHLLRNLFLSLSDQPRIRSYLRLIALLITFPLRYLDKLFSRTQGAYNSACAFYFFGRKRIQPISDRDILSMFRGK